MSLFDFLLIVDSTRGEDFVKKSLELFTLQEITHAEHLKDAFPDDWG